jgi:HAD superfamily hydrolase (TIGR01509 family)
MNTPEWARYLSEDLGVGLPPEQVAAEVVERVAARYETDLPLMPGAVEAVTRVAARWPVGLASSSPRLLIDRVLDLMGLRSVFSVVISTEEVGRGKPAPDVYLAAADRLGVPATSCAAVEDSSNGLRAARAAGAVVIAVPHPRYPPDADALAGADLVLRGLDDLTIEALLEIPPRI